MELIIFTIASVTLFFGILVMGKKAAAKRPKRNKDHLAPKYYGYNGGFSSIVTCKDCGLTGLYEDFHPVDPCYRCGSEHKTSGVGRWNGVMWEKPILKENNGERNNFKR